VLKLGSVCLVLMMMVWVGLGWWNMEIFGSKWRIWHFLVSLCFILCLVHSDFFIILFFFRNTSVSKINLLGTLHFDGIGIDNCVDFHILMGPHTMWILVTDNYQLLQKKGSIFTTMRSILSHVCLCPHTWIHTTKCTIFFFYKTWLTLLCREHYLVN